tara:strand:- start:211 stop:999 length:789 start_codon:yes stop_codon:yes gene_type:complete
MDEASLLYENRDGIAWLTMNRPDDMNAISIDMIDLFEKYLSQIASDDAVRVLAITGSGTAFCAGADLKQVLDSFDLPPGETNFVDRLCNNVLNPLRDFPKPVIAVLNGITVAGGLEAAMCADLVVAAQSAKIGDAHANFGVYPGAGGAAVLPRIIPHNVAKYLLFTGKTLSSQEMKGYGFVNEVVADENLQDAAQRLALHIAQKSPIALRRMKAVANAALDKSRDNALLHEQVEYLRHQRSYDMSEGLSAFVEKRKPRFEGR